MRCIDANTLIQKANYEADGMTEPFKSQFGVLVEWLVDKTPTIEPERKTGKWIVHYECPKCGEITKNYTEYCPFCGADM